MKFVSAYLKCVTMVTGLARPKGSSISVGKTTLLYISWLR